jgi:hypothetical protein
MTTPSAADTSGDGGGGDGDDDGFNQYFMHFGTRRQSSLNKLECNWSNDLPCHLSTIFQPSFKPSFNRRSIIFYLEW